MARAARSGDAQGFESTSLAANGYRHANAFVLPVFPRGAASASASGIRVARVRPRSLSISYMIREPAAGNRPRDPTLSGPAIEPFPPAGEPGPDQKIVAAFRQIDRAYYVPRNRHDDPL